MRAVACLLASALASFAFEARAYVVYNNGLAPPNSANVIDHGIFADEYVYVNDHGCAASFACASPGAPTTVSIVAGGMVGSAEARNRSILLLDGGTVFEDVFMEELGSVVFSAGLIGDDLFARDVTMTGGRVAGDVSVAQAGSMRWSGGQIDGRVTLFFDTLFEVVGSGFAINGMPVPYGDPLGLALPPPNPDFTRTLSGFLASGEAFEMDYLDPGPSAVLLLVAAPEPGAALLVAVALAASVALRPR